MAWSEGKQPPTDGQEPLVVRMGRVRVKGPGPFPGWAWKAKSLVLTNEALVIPGNKIPLDHITKVERVDLKPYCLLVQVKDRTYHLSFDNDEELYDWKDDVYSRCPLIGVGSPSGFTHNVHVGFDQIASTLPSQWNALIDPSLAQPTSPTEDKVVMEDEKSSATSNLLPSLAYTTNTSQRPTMQKAARPRSAILDGQLSIRKDGFFTGWRWAARWIVLRNQTLTIYRSQVNYCLIFHQSQSLDKRMTDMSHHTQGAPSPAGRVINLDDITKVEVIKSRRLRIHTKSGKRYSLSFRVTEEVYMWRDAISPRIMSASGRDISSPWGFVHRQHVGFNPITGEFHGMPEAWRRVLEQT
ncbi:hypothetical protein C0992_012468 [Termitomyces sp. T32_za158]|nr:hypothetical protein C0992_012468 [Termitomyces sp. T32_za158]